MPFSPKKIKPEEETLAKLDEKDSSVRFKLEQNAKNKNLKAMNALKSVAPMLFWTLVENKENQLEFFREISQKLDALSGKLLEKLSLDEIQFAWARNQIERGLAEICGHLIATKKEVNWEEMESLLPLMAETMIKNSSEKEIYVSIDSSMSCKMALFYILNKFYLEMAGFAKHPDFHAEIQKAIEMAIELTNILVADMADKVLPEKERAELFKAGLNESAKSILFYWQLSCKQGFTSVTHTKTNVANYMKRLTKTVGFLIKN